MSDSTNSVAAPEPAPLNGPGGTPFPVADPSAKLTEDKLAPFRALFGMPVAVQFAQQVPYVQIAPLTDKHGNVQTVRVPGSDRVIGLPGVVEPIQPTAVAIGVMRASECDTWLIIEERLGIPRTAESLGGQALMDVHVRPEMVTHVSFVRAVELTRRRDEG
jgi:hypothetical protein